MDFSPGPLALLTGPKFNIFFSYFQFCIRKDVTSYKIHTLGGTKDENFSSFQRSCQLGLTSWQTTSLSDAVKSGSYKNCSLTGR